jgi:hypothetical protein
MKQNITIEQLRQLSKKGKEKLRQWSKNKVLLYCYPENLPYLSIGQMIEFLNDYKCIDIRYDNKHSSSATICYQDKDIATPFYWERVISVPNLCDALWEAVKESLNKEE